ncbi:DNA mismatch repair protein MutL, partial [candidate division KSB1 bacterium]
MTVIILQIEMKSKIKILPETVINRIAAGEVIERPASVVKELMENSIDAGSRNIEVRFKNGGKELIYVIDDGTGMSEEDAILCFERHSTSKVFKFEDLEKINTFGFRGEALSSIASVSIVELKTKIKEEKEGTYIRISGGKQEEIKKIPWNIGTSVSVKNIFFNVPGRRKFLKSNLSESRHIYSIFKKISLANTYITFLLFNDDKIVWKLREDSLENRLVELYNEEILTNSLKIDNEFNDLKLYGY